MLKIVFLGFPGSGKGTQSLLLSQKTSFIRISTGDIFRSIITSEEIDDLFGSVRNTVLHGELVSDELTFEIIKRRIDCGSSWILDGFPRNVAQALLLSNFCMPTHVIFIDVSVDLVFKRISGRRIAKDSEKMYNVYFSPPKQEGYCDISGEVLLHREDDSPDIVKKRLEVYERETQPLLAYYENKGLLHRVDGNLSIDEVYHNIKEVLSI